MYQYAIPPGMDRAGGLLPGRSCHPEQPQRHPCGPEATSAAQPSC